MHVNRYQEFVISLLSPESRTDQMVNAALGLTGEAGEYADLVKKHKHHSHEWDRTKALLELGDILFYVAEAADEQGATLEEVMMLNVQKLTKRYPKGRFDSEDSKTKADQVEPDICTPMSGGCGTHPDIKITSIT
jgi:NTP pyrophosphatase (non-canonical NTP hydrolase)